ncbi:MAG TPA: FtsX-like permease family protein [Candidatus Acidoferrales bacterium]|nr:FtsX-like permease family protein [Candidatus Acidoferrales bacterium]
MISLLGFVSLRHLARHRLRTALTLCGIVLGVAAITAIGMVNRTVLQSFQRTIDLVAGKAVLQVTNGESGVKESVFPVVRDAPGVAAAAASVEGFLPMTEFPGERLFLLGVDFLTDAFLRDHQFAGGALERERGLDFIAPADSIALTESLARRLGLALGARVALTTAEGVKRYTVRALLKEEGTARAFGGNIALMDLPVAQLALGKWGKLDTVDLTVEQGQDIEALRRRLADRLGGAAQVERPSKRGEQVESLIASFRVGLFFVSLVALFVGVFLIYNTVSVSVVQRRREIGILRCLGTARGQIMKLFLFEALALGLAGALGGLLAGVLLAKAALGAVTQTIGNLFFHIDASGTSLSWREVGLGLGGGIGVAVIAALQPAWEAARIGPAESARQEPWRKDARRFSRLALAALSLLAVAPLVWFFSPGHFTPVQKFSAGMTSMFLFLLGVCLLSPLITLLASGAILRALRAGFCVSARLACDGLARNPVRSGMTVSTLMISLAAIFTVAVLVHSVRVSLLSWVDQMVSADLVVHSSAPTAGSLNVPLKEEIGAAFKEIPGVKLVDFYRLIRSTYQGKPILIESFSARAARAVRSLPMVAGDGQETLRRMAAGEGVVVSESFESKFGKGRGDTLELPTPSGAVSFRILGVYVDYSSDAGSVLLDRALYSKLWGDRLVDAFDLWLEPGADRDAVIREIKEKYGERYQLFVNTHAELKQAVVGIMEQSFRVNYAVEVIAVIVAIFSVINTLIASVLDRTREIGVLRAIGATEGQLKAIFVLEAAGMGLLGGLLGLIAGTIMSYQHVVYNTKVLTGWTFQYSYPPGVAAACVLLTVALCLIVAYAPARRAAQLNIVKAIAYE